MSCFATNVDSPIFVNDLDEADVTESNAISHLFLNSLQFSLADSEEKGSLLPKSNVGQSVEACCSSILVFICEIKN